MFHRYIYQFIRYRFLKKKCRFAYSTIIGKKSFFEGMNQIFEHSLFSGYMGLGSYIASNSIILGKIGRFTSIGPSVKVNHAVHPYKEPFVTTSPYFFSPYKQNGYTSVSKEYFPEHRYADIDEKYPVIIGNDCWIGDGAFLIGGITIGDGAVILAHAVVTKNIPPYAICGGIPGRIIGYRYDIDTIEFLLRFKWWNKDINWLKSNNHLLRDINKLKEYVTLHSN